MLLLRPCVDISVHTSLAIYRFVTHFSLHCIHHKKTNDISSDHLLDPITKERIGTGRGYGFNINPTHSIGINGTGTDQGSAINSNRVFYMKDGETIHLYDLAIVAGTGSRSTYLY